MTFQKFEDVNYNDDMSNSPSRIYNFSGARSGWFDIDRIHQHEKNSFPGLFFDGSGAQFYFECRNKIINRYRQNMGENLSLEGCFRIFEDMENIDYETVKQIFKFLNENGIINTKKSNEKMCECGKMGIYFNENHLYVCEECFAEGKHGTSGKAEFYKINKDSLVLIWKKDEELRLLEGIEKFGDDWNEVANHVQSKNKEQCILKFLKLDIPKKISEHLKDYEVPPFLSTANPVMSVIAFLCSCVSPSVASEAAKWAINNFQDDMDKAVGTMLASTISRAQEQKEIEVKKLERMYGVMIETLTKKIEQKIADFDKAKTDLQKEKERLEQKREEYKEQIEEIKKKQKNSV